MDFEADEGFVHKRWTTDCASGETASRKRMRTDHPLPSVYPLRRRQSVVDLLSFAPHATCFILLLQHLSDFTAKGGGLIYSFLLDGLVRLYATK